MVRELVLLIMLCGDALAQEADKLADPLSKRRGLSGEMEREVTMDVPLVLEQKEVNQLRVKVRGSTLIAIQRKGLLDFLEGRLKLEVMSRFRGRLGGVGEVWVPPLEWRFEGVDFKYKRGSVQVEGVIPFELRKPQVVRLNRSIFEVDETNRAIKPEPTSWFVNNQLTWTRNVTDGVARWQGGVVQSHAMRAFGAVLEVSTDVRVQQDAKKTTATVNLMDVRATVDKESNQTRAELGDVSTRGYGGVPGIKMFGFKIGRMYELAPELKPFARPAQLVTLPYGGLVDIYVNERLARSIRLESGVHDLQQIPVDVGLNDVKVKVTEPGKESVVYQKVSFFDTVLLKEGAVDYQLGVGVLPLSQKGFEKVYDWKTPVMTGLWQRGVTDSVTVGASGLLSKSTMVGGVTIKLPTWEGLSTVEWATKKDANSESFGNYLQAGWTSTPVGWKGDASHFRQGFAVRLANGVYTEAAGSAFAKTDASYRTSWNVGQEKSVGITIQKSWFHDGEQFGLMANYGTVLGGGWSVDVGGKAQTTNRTSPQPMDRFSVFTTLKWSPKMSGFDRESNVFSVQNNGQSSAEYNRQDVVRDGVVRSEMKVISRAPNSTESGGRTLRGNSNYVTSRWEGDASWSQVQSQTGASEEVTIALRNSVGRAGGVWFTGRPIDGGAMVIELDQKLKNENIFVVEQNPTAAKSDGLGSMVISGLQLALTRELILDGEFKNGQTLGEDRFVVKPSHKSISVVKLKAAPRTQITGRAVNASGMPIQTTMFKLKNKKTGEETEMFTNKQGVFFSPTMKEGEYDVVDVEGSFIKGPVVVEASSGWKLDGGQMVWVKPKSVVK